jgi:hypothetical protein
MMPLHAYSNQVQDGKGINGLCDGIERLCRKLLHATEAMSVTLQNNSLFYSSFLIQVSEFSSFIGG